MMRYFSLFCFSLMLISCQNEESPPSKTEQKKHSVLKVSSAVEPHTLDPRLSRTLANITYIKMFYEGLISEGKDGELTPGLAKSVDVSKDGKTYTFYLRNSLWSNGDAVTAYDFEYTLKSILSPNFPAPQAHQLFVIQGAQEAKEGKAPLDSVKIFAPDEKTLVIELKDPMPFFLDLTSTVTFYPVHKDWAKDTSFPLIGNGPFLLSQWKKQSEIQVKKNPNYWNAEDVKLEGITFMLLDENTALKMFQTKEIDWSGSPLSAIPLDAKTALKENNNLKVASALGTHWLQCNTKKFPLNHAKLRKALSLAINRQEIVDHITQGMQIAATGVIPLSFGIQTLPYFEDHSLNQARELFEESLAELNLKKEQFPTLTLAYSSTELYGKIAQTAQMQWKEAFGIDVKLEGYESKIYFSKLVNRDYMLGIGSFYADYKDPINFLEIFKSKNNLINSSQWENKQFTELLNLSTRVTDKRNRTNILRRAEKILMEEMPVIPLYYNCYNYVKNDSVEGVYFSELGYLDFKSAYFN